ncbi:MAG: DUF2254 domain-containing protein [Thiothrix sp.]|nr:MAG: DUF2254 domain-containing protein [Thiothrix sp.]
MLFRLKVFYNKLSNKLWLRPALAGLFAISMAVFAYYVGYAYNSSQLGLNIDESSLVSLFSIFASSMLSVATFTVSAIVAAASSVSNSTTYRATQYVLGDKKAQLVLSAFIAAFIYSIIGILSLKAFTYGHTGRFVLFLGLIVIVSFVLIAFINWVDHAMTLGRQESILNRLTDVALDSITPEVVNGFGATVWDEKIPEHSKAIYPRRYGYIVGLDAASLQEIAEEADCYLVITTRPGELSDPTQPIVYVTPSSAVTEELVSEIQESFVSANRRYPEADIRYNLINLAETADRALSSAVNDPGTAINVITRQTRILAKWAEVQQQVADEAPKYPRLSILPTHASELVSDSFAPIARDGAGVIEVGVRLQKALQTVARLGNSDLAAAAKDLSAVAMEFANQALVVESQRQRLAKVASQIA